jgi:hypothetical protein
LSGAPTSSLTRFRALAHLGARNGFDFVIFGFADSPMNGGIAPHDGEECHLG